MLPLLRPNQPLPEVLAMFREAMKQQGNRSDFHDNVMEVKASQGNARAYSVNHVQQECKPEVVQSIEQPWHLAANRKQKDPTPGAKALGGAAIGRVHFAAKTGHGMF